MANKELLGTFKSAPWKSPEEIELFLVGLGEVPSSELLKLLEFLNTKSSPTEPAHRVRLTVFKRLTEGVKDKALFVPLVKMLGTKDASLRSVLMELIPAVNNISEHSELCGLLRSPEPAVRQTAAQVLKKIGGKTVLTLLSQLVQEANFQGRLEALDVLVQTAGPYAIPSLQYVLAGGKPAEKMHALRYLGDPRFVQKEAADALQVIQGALNDPTEAVSLRAIASYAALCSEDAWFTALSPALDSLNLNVVKAAVETLRRFSSPRVVSALERKLRMGPNIIRLTALATLEVIGNDEVLPALTEALSLKQIVVRTRAGEVLSSLSRAGKIDLSRTVIWLLRSRDENVRRMAIDLAKSVKDPNGNLWPKLLACLRDEDWWVRERVVDTVVEIAGKDLTRHVVGYLQDPSDVVRRYAVEVLIRLKDPQALGALVRTVSDDTDWWVKERAIEGMTVLQDERSVPYLIDIMQANPDLRIVCLEALARLKAAPAVEPVCALLSEPDPDLRYAALDFLRALDDPQRAAQVRPLAQDSEARIKNAAKALLVKWNIDLGNTVTAEVGTSMLDRLLMQMAQTGCDDLIIASGRQAMVKRMNRVVPLTRNALTSEQVQVLLRPQLVPEQLAELEALRDVDFSYSIKSAGLRFRANVFQHTGGMAAVFRVIKGKLPALEELGLPSKIVSFGDMSSGLVLVGGPTGSGKSTTLAALINYINRNQRKHIISLEDPIEVVHTRLKSLVTQREIGTHTRSFSSSLRATLRQDPDVILVGEMRDLATISFAVSAAETGHLVFGTLHTVSADTSIDRLINAFPGGQQDQVRSMLAESVRAVVCQYLLRPKSGEGRKLALEVMLNSDAVSSLIRKGKCYQIPSIIATSGEQGMQLMDQDLLRLVKAGEISADEGYMKARNKKEFEPFLEGGAPLSPSTGAVPNSTTKPAAATKPAAPRAAGSN
ncbi:MAG: PilT/PilU family type 4a pilus ATPase [Myxococcaceae bacterium]